MYTLAAATRRAQREAARREEPVYLIERPNDELPAEAPVEQRPGAAERSEPSDPITFDALSGLSAAILLLQHFDVELLRVAYPDGMVAAVADRAAAGSHILARHGEAAAACLAQWGVGRRAGATEGQW